VELKGFLRDSILGFAVERNDEDLFGLTFILAYIGWTSDAEALRGRIFCSCSSVGIVDCVGVMIGVGGGVNGELIGWSKIEGLGCKACGLNGGVDSAIDGMTAGLEVGSPLLLPNCIFLDLVLREKKPIWRACYVWKGPSRQVTI
jgi:hypothetical protein